MPDILSSVMAGIPDEASLANMAGGFNDRAVMLSRESGTEAAAWANVYHVLALSAESALLRRQTGVSL